MNEGLGLAHVRTAGVDVKLSSLWQARFVQTFDDALEILGVLVWKHLATMLYRVGGIDA